MNSYEDLIVNSKDKDFQSILTNPILDIAARFWDEDRYQAFKVCYRSMREIDDLVDDRKAAGGTLDTTEQESYTNNINDLIATLSGNQPTDNTNKKLLTIISDFKVPLWPWERLAKAMIYDIKNDGFDSFVTFRRYTEGAAIAPASVFMHLCGIRHTENGYKKPEFDICKAARPLAIFSYLVHIMRDYEKDQTRNLNYFASDILQQHDLTAEKIRSLCKSGIVDQRIRNVFSDYKKMADYYRSRALQTVEKTIPSLRPKYQLSLNLIYSLYLQIYDSIDCEKGSFSTEELNPTPAEVQQQIDVTVKNFRPVE
jgi:phytoene/squalene synthetase